MSQNLRTLMVAAVIIALASLALNRSTGQIPNAVQIDQWEYHYDDKGTANANSLGKEGWELVTVWVQNDVSVRAIYKRPLR